MLLSQISSILNAEIVVGFNKDIDVKSICASDLMSDVLACVKEQAVLLTGLNNPQVVRTAEMMDMRAIVFVRGKNPCPEVIELAKEKDIAIFKTDLTMYVCAGELYLFANNNIEG